MCVCLGGDSIEICSLSFTCFEGSFSLAPHHTLSVLPQFFPPDFQIMNYRELHLEKKIDLLNAEAKAKLAKKDKKGKRKYLSISS